MAGGCAPTIEYCHGRRFVDCGAGIHAFCMIPPPAGKACGYQVCRAHLMANGVQNEISLAPTMIC
jgi:hypothetical protein